MFRFKTNTNKQIKQHFQVSVSDNKCVKISIFKNMNIHVQVKLFS